MTIFFPTAAIFFSLAIVCSCQTPGKREWKSQDILAPETSSVESLAFAKTITENQAKEDIDFLIYLLNYGYAGKNHVPLTAFNSAIQSLQAIDKNLSISDFHDRIDDALFLIPDNHLHARYRGKVSKKRAAYEDSEVGSVGENNITDPKTVWEVRLDPVKQKKILYISIIRFPSSQSTIWAGFAETVRRQKENADAVVIDLRGNSGGDDAKGMQLAEILYGHPIEHPIKKQYRSLAPASMALYLNRLFFDIFDLKSKGEKIPEYLAEQYEYEKQQYKFAADGKFPPEYIRTDKGKGSRLTPITGFKKPIYILMDRPCGSSCEFTIATFEWNPYAKRVGENTSGTFHFSNAGLALLPNSKIRVWVPSQFNEYFDKRFIERSGFSPDIRIKKGQDAYEAVKKLFAYI